MDTGFDRWCQQVTDRVRFRPDRAGIAAELRDHYEDHKQALLDLGYDEELAAQRSLEAMGDAQEVGKALNKVHKYWLGMLWRVSKFLLILVVIIGLSGLWQSRDRVEDPFLRTQGQLSWEAPPSTAEHVRAYNADISWDLLTMEETAEGWLVTARIWFQMDTPFGFGPSDAIRRLEFRDDRGELPRQNALPAEVNTHRFAAPSTADSWTKFFCTVELILDHKPAWVEVSYPYGAAPFTLRDTWEEGAV